MDTLGCSISLDNYCNQYERVSITQTGTIDLKDFLPIGKFVVAVDAEIVADLAGTRRVSAPRLVV